MDRVLRHIPDHQLGGQQDKFLGNGEWVCSLVRSLERERWEDGEQTDAAERLVDSPVGGVQSMQVSGTHIDAHWRASTTEVPQNNQVEEVTCPVESSKVLA